MKKYNSEQSHVDFGSELNEKQPLLYFGKAIVNGKGENIKEVRTSEDTDYENLCCGQDIFNEIKSRKGY